MTAKTNETTSAKTSAIPLPKLKFGGGGLNHPFSDYHRLKRIFAALFQTFPRHLCQAKNQSSKKVSKKLTNVRENLTNFCKIFNSISKKITTKLTFFVMTVSKNNAKKLEFIRLFGNSGMVPFCIN
jgi:hypothetical protein